MTTPTQSSYGLTGYYMVLAAILAATIVDILVKFISDDIGTWQLVFLRWAVTVAFMLPWVLLSKQGSIRANSVPVYIYRALLNCIGSFTLFYSLATLPLSMVVTILFSGPVFMVPLAYFILSEKPQIKDLASCVLGFIGIVVVYNPTEFTLSFESLAPMVSTISFALLQILTKKHGANESAPSLMFWLAVATSLVTIPFAATSWTTLSPFVYGIIFLMALSGTLGSMLMIIGLRRVEVPKAAPLNYLTVPLAFIAAWFLFNEQPSMHTIVGCIIIITAVTLPKVDKLFSRLNYKAN